MQPQRGKGETVKRGALALLCSLSPLLLCAPAAAQTSAIPVAVVLMLPNTWAGETFSGMTFHPTNRGRTLLLWPCTNCGGSGTSIVTQVTVNGLTNLNGLTNGSQTFVVGNGGTDFAIVSAAGVHTFNLPTASASVRGALSSADWSTFAGKQSPITVQTQGVVLATAPTTWNFTSGATGYVSGATMVLGMSASGGAPAGANNQVQFYQDGAFAATSRLDYVRAVHSLIVSGLDGLGSNETRAKIVMTNDTGTRLEVNASGLSSQGVIQFNIGPNAALFGSNVMNLIAGLGLNPGVSNDLTLGGANNPWSTANAVNAILKDRLTLGIGPGLVSSQRTNASPDTNVIWHSFFAPSAGQVRKFHSVTYDAAGTAHIVETNATDATGGGGGASGGFVSGITNIGYSTTNLIVDLSATNYSVWNVTNTGGPVNVLFTNLTEGFNFTLLIDGVDLDGTTSATNALVTYVWPHASVAAQWLGFTTNTYVTSNKVLGVSGLIRRTNSVIISSRE